MSRNDDNSFVYKDLDDVQGEILFSSAFFYNAWIPIITQSNQYYHEESIQQSEIPNDYKRIKIILIGLWMWIINMNPPINICLSK